MADKRYRSGSIVPRRGNIERNARALLAARRGGSGDPNKDYLAQLKAQELGLNFQRLDLEQQKFLYEIANNEQQRQHEIAKLAMEGANAQELAAKNNEYKQEQLKLENELKTQLENTSAENKTLGAKGYLPGQRNMYEQYQTPLINYEGAFQQENPDLLDRSLKAKMLSQETENSLKSAQAEQALSNSLLKSTAPTGEETFVTPQAVRSIGGMTIGLPPDTGGRAPVSYFNPVTNEGLKPAVVQPPNKEPILQLNNPATSQTNLGWSDLLDYLNSLR